MLLNGVRFNQDNDALAYPVGATLTNLFDRISLNEEEEFSSSYGLTTPNDPHDSLFYDGSLVTFETQPLFAAGAPFGSRHKTFHDTWSPSEGRILARVIDEVGGVAQVPALLDITFDFGMGLYSEEFVAQAGDVLPGQPRRSKTLGFKRTITE